MPQHGNKLFRSKHVLQIGHKFPLTYVHARVHIRVRVRVYAYACIHACDIPSGSQGFVVARTVKEKENRKIRNKEKQKEK